MSAVEVLRAPERLRSALSPIRMRLIQGLAEPDSAAGLARRLGLPRQKVNYHLRALEDEGFVELAEERQRRGCVERCMKLTSRAFLIDPQILGEIDPALAGDRFSSGYLVGAASQMLREVGAMRERAQAAKKPLITSTMEAEVGFATPADFNAFSAELAECIARLAAKYDAPASQKSRKYRLTLGLYPKEKKS